MEEKQSVVKGRAVSRVLAQAGLGLFRRLGQIAFPLQPSGPTKPRVSRGWVRFHSMLETSAGAVQTAEAMKLMAEHDQQGRVMAGQLFRSIKGLGGKSKVQISRRYHSQLEPKIDDGGKSLHQLLISGKGQSGTPCPQLLPRSLPAKDVLRRPFEFREVGL
jgi:hypothetical protein